MIVAIVAAAAVGGGALLFAMSRKKGARAAPAPKEEPAAAEKASRSKGAPKVKAGPVPAMAAKPAPKEGNHDTRDQARKLIDSTQEEIADLIENPKEGVDEMAAMAMLEMAQEEFKEGNHGEALRLAREARSSLEAKAAPAAAAARKDGQKANAPASKGLTCTECGEGLEPGWPTCPVCGEKV
jgi:rubrerythrin